MEGGTAHDQEYDRVDQLVCLGVPPAPVYKGARGGGWPTPIGAPGGVRRGKEVGREKEKGAPPPLS